jgi:hypothetical protein
LYGTDCKVTEGYHTTPAKVKESCAMIAKYIDHKLLESPENFGQSENTSVALLSIRAVDNFEKVSVNIVWAFKS